MNRKRVMESDYMKWAKRSSHARFNLATSGLLSCSIEDLPFALADLQLSGPSFYGYEPLQQALANKSQVSVECVVAANGTSMANHLVMAALLEPGDEVLIEHPVYDLLESCAGYLGAEVRSFPRRFENGFRIDPSEVERAITPRTRLIILTNLHNPTSVLTEEPELIEVGNIAKKMGARVLVDEVYLDSVFDQPRRTAFHLGDHFITTSSLTKVYGLSGLRCGWIVASPDLAARIWKLNDLFGVIPAHPAERLSVIALADLERLALRARTLIGRNRTILEEFINSRGDLSVVNTESGTVRFPRLLTAPVDRFCGLLREKYETSVVPGEFFGMPEHFRLGIGGDTDILKEGLNRIAQALDELKSS